MNEVLEGRRKAKSIVFPAGGRPPTPPSAAEEGKDSSASSAPPAAAEASPPPPDEGTAFTARGLAVLLIGAVRCGVLRGEWRGTAGVEGSGTPTIATASVSSGASSGSSPSSSPQPQPPPLLLVDCDGWMAAWNSRALTLGAWGEGGGASGFGADSVAGIMAAVAEGGLRLPSDVMQVLVGTFLQVG